MEQAEVQRRQAEAEAGAAVEAVVLAVEAVEDRLLEGQADDVARQRVEAELDAGQVVLALVVGAALVLLAEIVAVEGGELEAQARHGLAGVRRLGASAAAAGAGAGSRHVEHDLDPAVAGLADIVGGRDPQVLLTAADHDHVGGRHAQPLELGRDHLRPALGQAQIVGGRARGVGEAGDVDPGTAGGAELLGRLGDDALVVRGQRRLVPGEEHQVPARALP